MPTVEVTDEQLAYLEQLRTRLADEHVGDYGYVRHQDAIQYLIDTVEPAADGSLASISTESEPDDESTESDTESEAARLTAMMQLLETHEDKWDETDSEDANYVVELPDGSEERVRTRDDVRATLFKHYR